MAVEIGQIQKITSPNPFALLSTRKGDGGTNLMAISWWTYASNHPATVVACLSKKGYSGQCIMDTGEFVLNIVDESLKEPAFACGTCSGRNVDKPKALGIGLANCQVVATKRVSHVAAAMECRLLEVIALEDHHCFVAEVVATHLDPQRKPIFAWNGYQRLDVAK